MRYFIQQSNVRPDHWNVLCDEGDGVTLFTQAYQGPEAEREAQELADYMNAGGC